MKRMAPLFIIFLCLTAACIIPSGQQALSPSPPQPANVQDFTIMIYSGENVSNIPYDIIVNHSYAEIPDKASGFHRAIQAGSYSGNATNIARIALRDPCIRKILSKNGVVLGVDYSIPFHGEPAPRFIMYLPGKSLERRISAYVNETCGCVGPFLVEYRYDAISSKPGFNPFTTEGWAGGHTCEKESCNNIC